MDAVCAKSTQVRSNEGGGVKRHPYTFKERVLNGYFKHFYLLFLVLSFLF